MTLVLQRLCISLIDALQADCGIEASASDRPEAAEMPTGPTLPRFDLAKLVSKTAAGDPPPLGPLQAAAAEDPSTQVSSVVLHVWQSIRHGGCISSSVVCQRPALNSIGFFCFFAASAPDYIDGGRMLHLIYISARLLMMILYLDV